MKAMKAVRATKASVQFVEEVSLRVSMHVGRAQSAPGAISVEKLLVDRVRGALYDTDFGEVEWPCVLYF